MHQRSIHRSDGQGVQRLLQERIQRGKLVVLIPALQFLEYDLQPVAPGLGGCVVDTQQDLIKKAVAYGADYHADAIPLLSADQSLGVGVGLVVVLLRNGEDFLGQFGVYVSASVEYPVHCAAGGACQLCDFLDGYHWCLRLPSLT